ncbi:hypothetical protein M408DRAFT_329100 [Serendipita vermifera MAFF 305830]|uniref:Uncharacterized protein n=1 Tax=Serendipita vermifera MAFF 305830 TaxID=933852 RepID=A0A0C3BCF0_SERVB|nr:hypothetical protein M408DRAFT_329100 [Serendipita vermifera MAFF 305830]
MASAVRILVSRSLVAERGAQYRILRRPATISQSTLRYSSGVALPDKFQGKRTTLNVQIPDLEEAEPTAQMDPANIPFLPDNFRSATVSSEIEAEKAGKAGTPLPGETPLPKVVTAVAEGSMPGGGVSSNIFQKSEDIKEFVGIQTDKASGTTANLTSLEGWKNTLGNLQNSALGSIAAATSASDKQGESDPKRTELDGHDVNGLYVLGGIVAGGWLLGGLLAKKGVQPAKPSESH